MAHSSGDLKVWCLCIGSVLVRAVNGNGRESVVEQTAHILSQEAEREKLRPGSHIPLHGHFPSDLKNFKGSTAPPSTATLATKPLHMDFGEHSA